MMTISNIYGQAETKKKALSRTTTVRTEIRSDISIIWALLTNGPDLPRWNSTITQLEGDIQLGSKIKLRSILDDKRVFKLKIKELVPEKKLVWGDGKGNRVYTLTEQPNGLILFEMTEKIGGLMFPMYAKFIPSFDQVFEQFASDLKREAELIANMP